MRNMFIYADLSLEPHKLQNKLSDMSLKLLQGSLNISFLHQV